MLAGGIKSVSIDSVNDYFFVGVSYVSLICFVSVSYLMFLGVYDVFSRITDWFVGVPCMYRECVHE